MESACLCMESGGDPWLCLRPAHAVCMGTGPTAHRRSELLKDTQTEQNRRRPQAIVGIVVLGCCKEYS